MSGRGLHRTGTLVLSLLMSAIGIGLIVESLAAVGGVVSSRLLLGVLFLAAGGARLYLLGRGRRT